jgi:hypothetical protein
LLVVLAGTVMLAGMAAPAGMVMPVDIVCRLCVLVESLKGMSLVVGSVFGWWN